MPSFAHAEDPPAISADPSADIAAVNGRFVRLERDDDGEIMALETAVVRYGREGEADAPIVDLIGAIHVGEREYYLELNKAFRDYDVVLYELVAPENDRPEPGRRSANPVSMLQVGMKSLLGLHFQLDHINYTARNLIHADLSPEEFAKSMADRGESMSQMFFRMMGQSMALQSKDPARSGDARLLAALFSRDRGKQLKRVMAEQFEDTLAVPSILDGPEGSTIITVRNRRAMDVLAKQLDGGKQKIAVFYGAAHLPDMEVQLRNRFHLEPQTTTWVTAWSMR